MKIVFYINVLSHGGAERVISNVANMMSEKGHECVMVNSFSIENEYPLKAGVRRVLLADSRIEGFVTRNIVLTYRLSRLLKQEMPDLVLSFMAEPNFRSCIATINKNIKTIISVRNDPAVEYGNIFLKWLSKLLFCLADGVVFQTNDAMNWFPKCIRKKGIIIYNSVSETFFKQRLSSNASGIVTTGRLCPQKNHKLLIDAFCKIKDRVQDDLVIYGSGDPSELEVYVKEIGLSGRVHFPGVISDVANTISNHKLYVLSSNYEGMPNALMEAMALGMPCISTDCPCGGPRMLFSEKMAQFLIPVKDVDTLSMKMLYLLQNQSERDMMSYEAIQQSKLFHPSIINSKWEEYLMSFVGSSI